MATAAKSPRISHVSWGRIKVGNRTFKDAMVFPGGAKEWDWNETGTSHTPGIQPADVKQLIDAGARVIVLSRGMQERLQVDIDTMFLLGRKNIQVHVLQTEEAVRRYNELCETEAVAGLFHTTC